MIVLVEVLTSVCPVVLYLLCPFIRKRTIARALAVNRRQSKDLSLNPLSAVATQFPIRGKRLAEFIGVKGS